MYISSLNIYLVIESFNKNSFAMLKIFSFGKIDAIFIINTFLIKSRQIPYLRTSINENCMLLKSGRMTNNNQRNHSNNNNGNNNVVNTSANNSGIA